LFSSQKKQGLRNQLGLIGNPLVLQVSLVRRQNVFVAHAQVKAGGSDWHFNRLIVWCFKNSKNLTFDEFEAGLCIERERDQGCLLIFLSLSL
jgi:hypothetical protein